MSKSHLKRLAVPKTWDIKKKGIKFVTRPNLGAHPRKLSVPINLVIRDLLSYAKSNKEVKYILQNKEVLVDGIRRKEIKFPVGLFDVVEFKGIEKQFRMILNKKGKLCLIPIEKKE